MKKSFFSSLALATGLFFLFLPFLIHLISYLHPIVLVVVYFCVFIMVFFSVLLTQRERIHLPSSLLLWLFIFYTLALLVLLFFRPNNPTYHSMNLIPFSTIAFYLSGKVDFLISFYNLSANIGLFIPYGIFLMIVFNKFIYNLLILPFVFISLIEILQYMTHRGSLDIDDLILNMLGVFIGYLFYPIFKRVFIIK
jgi:glycopeptide antibiotics resistance protein